MMAEIMPGSVLVKRLHVVFDARSVADRYPGIGRYGSGLTRALADMADLRLTLLVDLQAASTFHSLPDVERVPIASGPTSLSQQWVIPGVLRRLQADVYHSPYYLMPYRLPCPTVVTLYDLIPLVVHGTHSAPFRLIYRAAHHLAAGAVNRIIAISHSTAADLVKIGLPARKISVIPLGVGPEFHPRPEEEIVALRQRYDLPERFALYVGTNKPHKNLPRLIEAWALVTGKMSASLARPWKLVIAGREDSRYPRAADLAAISGMESRNRADSPVHTIGPVPDADLPALYSAASLFIFPSLYEGFGLPVLEAMACGAPVICSNTSSLPEVAGDAALMVDPLDAGAVAEVIGRAVESEALRQRLSAQGTEHAAKFSWEQTARKTLEIYIEQSRFGGRGQY